MTYWDLVLGSALMFVISGLFVLLGVIIGGLFVLRTKRDAYEPLLMPLKAKEEEAAYNVDDFRVEQEEVNVNDVMEKIFQERAEEAQNDPSSQANSRMKEQMDG